MVKDTGVDCGSQVVYVGDEDIFLAVIDELIQQSRVVEALIGVSVPWWVPAAIHI